MHTQGSTHLINYRELIEESAEDLYEQAPCGYFSSLPDGTIVKINQTLLDWLGFNREEVIYIKKIQNLLSIGGRIFYETHYSPLLRMQGFVKEINYDLLRKDCSVLPVLVTSRQLKNKEGQPLLNRTTVFDISDRKKYELELLAAKKKAEEATKAKAQFLSTISHEIRTPMNAVIGITNLLIEKDPSAEQEELLNVLKTSAGHLLSLVNDVLDFSKIESGKILLEEKNFNIRDLIYSIVYSLGIRGEEKGILVHSQIDENLPSFLVGDPVKLGQVITNLIGNAIKFTHKGAVTLRLQVKEVSGQRVSVDFSVTDTGIGIPKEKQEHIFEEFSQGGYDINQKYGGTGLGLTISRKLLELHGSKLQLKSEPGQGSVFYFNLTLKAGKEEAEQKICGTDDTHTKAQSLQGVKILIAEDNEVNVMVLGQFLSKWGATYERVENGQQAIDKVTSGDYDLVMMDLQMPEMDGYQASSHIRRLKGEKYQAIPIIALSAFAKNEIEALLQEAGINDFVSKPFNPKELFSKIASYTTDKKDTSLSDQKAVVSPISGNDSPAGASFNLSEYKKITSNNAELTHLLKLSIRDLMLFKHESADVLQKREKGLLEKMVHKNRTIITLLEAKKLQALVAESVLLLEHGDDSSIQKTIQALHHELDFVINGLTQHLAL